ncbi:MAG: hypothetical protein FWF46_01855 [Oscillospiraceae bacterium]|nr:hypothetical protein [Oscillospiraceae bacterium]
MQESIESKSAGKGSTGRTTANNSTEIDAMQKVLDDPLGNSKKINLKTENKLINDLRWENWEKRATNINGVEIHFNYDPVTGQFDDFKFIDR